MKEQKESPGEPFIGGGQRGSLSCCYGTRLRALPTHAGTARAIAYSQSVIDYFNHCQIAFVGYQNTINTLKYADRAKEIKTHVSTNIHTVESHVTEYQRIISELQGEVSHLREALAEKEELLAEEGQGQKGGGMPSGEQALWQVLEQLSEQLQANAKERVNLQKAVFELQDQNMGNQCEVANLDRTLQDLHGLGLPEEHPEVSIARSRWKDLQEAMAANGEEGERLRQDITNLEKGRESLQAKQKDVLERLGRDALEPASNDEILVLATQNCMAQAQMTELEFQVAVRDSMISQQRLAFIHMINVLEDDMGMDRRRMLDLAHSNSKGIPGAEALCRILEQELHSMPRTPTMRRPPGSQETQEHDSSPWGGGGGKGGSSRIRARDGIEILEAEDDGRSHAGVRDSTYGAPSAAVGSTRAAPRQLPIGSSGQHLGRSPEPRPGEYMREAWGSDGASGLQRIGGASPQLRHGAHGDRHPNARSASPDKGPGEPPLEEEALEEDRQGERPSLASRRASQGEGGGRGGQGGGERRSSIRPDEAGTSTESGQHPQHRISAARHPGRASSHQAHDHALAPAGRPSTHMPRSSPLNVLPAKSVTAIQAEGPGWQPLPSSQPPPTLRSHAMPPSPRYVDDTGVSEALNISHDEQRSHGYHDEQRASESHHRSQGYHDEQRSQGYYDEQRSQGYHDEQRSQGYHDEQRSQGYFEDQGINRAQQRLGSGEVPPESANQNQSVHAKSTASKRNIPAHPKTSATTPEKSPGKRGNAFDRFFKSMFSGNS
ncbi:hypothetical protein CYMTET_18839 [Cymbomonas tetramitiformis]|uniref:Kinesin motor domain-containing protein n=1 Tax=Cymbomonas tetramitiformis TaxID=36881 RepID=A0AAE0G784_9CHLO|nr:hypothetical protein CYMTET_18839 [Cymbomonas tetramitiformis]